ncbi:MAG TPA: protease HtpX [Usitatibacter sp.]|jgi:heat shock protein HtpX|nr:protease HtpX [Usitatibacter sp.]
MKRIFLFLITNVAVLLVLSVTTQLLGVNRWLAANGIDYASLLVFAAIMGFGGAIISLLLSKTMAKFAAGVHVIEAPQTADEQWLVATVKRLADKAGVGMPEVGIFAGAPNAFATGAFKNSSLVAVSTGLLESMTREEVEAVLGHEMAHIANGDMVTLTLIQGVVNTFVVFLARVVGYAVDKTIFRTERGIGPGFYITVFVCEIVFALIASIIVAWFSRQREFRADAGSAGLLGTPRPMIAALRRLGGVEPGVLPQSFQAHGIAEGHNKFLGLFASHPPIAERIAALEARRPG